MTETGLKRFAPDECVAFAECADGGWVAWDHAVKVETERDELQRRLDRICDLVGERGPDKAFVMIGRTARGEE